MYINYIFDLYGTLIDIWTDEYSDTFWKKAAKLYRSNGASYTYKKLHSEYIKAVDEEKAKIHKLYPDFEHIDIDLLAVFKKLYDMKNVQTDEHMLNKTAKEFRFLSIEHINLYDGVLDLLETLKSKNKRIYLLSNAQRSFTLPELEKTGILQYFDGILISSDVKCAKPDQYFFKALFDKYNLKKSESIMIGNDQNTDIFGAFCFKIDSLYIYQRISPPINDDIMRADYQITDGNVYKIKELIIK